MFLHEALKTGRPFKRPSWGAGSWMDTATHSTIVPKFTIEDALADDWQVQPLEKKKVVRYRYRYRFGRNLKDAYFADSGDWYLGEVDFYNRVSSSKIIKVIDEEEFDE